MSTYVLMRILESSPERYERGLALLTLGGTERAYARLVDRLREGDRVLDLGCGTGALSRRAARRGCRVVGIDVNAGMLEVARRWVQEEGLGARVELREAGVAELGGEPDGSYDAVMSGLCFSELSDDERRHALAEARRLLRPGGLLLLADEARPRSRAGRLLLGALRAPLVVLTYLVSQQTSHPVADLEEGVARAGLEVLQVRRSPLGGFIEIAARKRTGSAS